MKKTIVSLLAAGALALALAQPVFARGSEEARSKVLRVGATPVPHAELLNLVKEDLAAQGFELQVVEFTDYVLPNSGLIAGDLEANFFQHLPYLQSNEEWTSKLAAAFGVHIEPFGLYSDKFRDIADLPDNATVAIPNDPSNGGRALLLLASKGIITLRAGVGSAATPLDITANPKNLSFRELEAAQLPRSLQDVDAAAINGNYALEAGINPTKDALIIEGGDSPYVNYIVIRKGSENDARIVALKQALLSQKIKDYIGRTWSDGSVIPVF
ncbi:MAG: MetQ/NlpA family ABC transporter substrate-binding protein [Treponema sp.]|jgi:D-methionine transport system substrate-binding protein|nr:MetQ/NlpA family ABC transporter substrate-binding protein [Treponema sp.]